MTTGGFQLSAGELIAQIIWRSNNSRLVEAQKRIDAMRSNLRELSQATAVGGAVITGFSALALRELGITETAYAKLEGQVGLLPDEIAAARPVIQSIAREFGLTEAAAAEAYFTITSAGLRGQASLDALRVAAMSSASELGDIREVVRVLIPTMTAYGAANQGAARSGDQLAAAVRLGNFEAPLLARALPVLIANAADAGVSFGDLAAAMALASRVQPRLQENATGLRQVLLALTAPTEQARMRMEELGLSSTALRDSLGSRGLLPTLITLRDAVGDDDVALREVLGSVEALTVFNNILVSGLETARSVFDEVNSASGDLATTYSSFDSTAALEMRRVMAQIRDLMAQIGEHILPVFLAAVEAITPIFQLLSAELQSGNQSFAQLIRLLAIAGPLLIATSIAARVLSAALLLVGALNPIGAIIVGVVAFIGLVIVLVKYWRQVWDFVTGIARIIGSIGSAIFGGGGTSAPAVASAPPQSVVSNASTVSNVGDTSFSSADTYNISAIDPEGTVAEIERLNARNSQSIINNY